MDTLLIVVTAVALAMAIAMAGVVVKLLRDERLRSAARVAALSAAVEDGHVHVQGATSDVPRADVRRADVRRAEVRPADKLRHGPLSIDPREPAWDMRDLDLSPTESQEHVARRTPHVAREHVAREHVAREHVARQHVAPGTSDAAHASSLFAAESAPSPWGARLAVAAGLAAMVGFGGYVLLTRPSAAPSEPAIAQSVPLELLSLTHKQQPQSLTVTGLVQNPRAAGAVSRVVATAFLFSEDTTFLGSGRAALDYSTLAPGDESPFVITIPVSAPVARYRIGFRDESGRVIAHVDRRTNATMAQMAR